jgi:hypothetical protein
MQQLEGLDEFRDDQGIIKNRNAKIGTTVLSLYYSALISITFTSKNNQANGKWQNRIFRSFGRG